MKVDLNKYSINRSRVVPWHTKNKDFDTRKSIVLLANLLSCPCIVLAFYWGEQMGFTPELIEIIDGYIGFYGYTEILGQREGSPYLTK